MFLNPYTIKMKAKDGRAKCRIRRGSGRRRGRSALLKSEIIATIKETKEGKAVRVDQIPKEMWEKLKVKALREICEIYHLKQL